MSFLSTEIGGFTLYELAAYFLIYSCMGWCVEVVFAAVTTGKLVNRGFLNGPVCPIYGFGMIGVLLLLTPCQDNILLLYLGGVLLPSLVELVAGWALYKLYRTRWWDYTDYPFNIGGYVCLEFSLLWGVGTLVMVKIIHPIVAMGVGMVPELAGLILMGVLYLVYLVDVVATAVAAAGLTRDLDTLEKAADSIHAVSDAMTTLLGSTAMDADQKMDESLLQFKLANAEFREAAAKLSPKETSAAIRAKTEEAMEAARRVSEEARLNASEAANAAKLAAQGTAERAAELLRLERLAAELQARTDEMQSQLLRSFPLVGKRRLLRAFPTLKHGSRLLTLDALRETLDKYRRPAQRPAEEPPAPQEPSAENAPAPADAAPLSAPEHADALPTPEDGAPAGGSR